MIRPISLEREHTARRTSCGKVRHATDWDALSEADRIRYHCRITGRRYVELNAYQCKQCGGWHLSKQRLFKHSA